MGHSVPDVEGQGHFALIFDDPAHGRLGIEGPFLLCADGREDAYEPPCPEWVGTVLRSLAGVRVLSARFDARSDLRIAFADGRTLSLPDGPFENWHFANGDGVRLHGGVGRVA